MTLESDSNLHNLPDLQLHDDDVYKILNERNILFESLQKEVNALKANLEHILQPFWQEIKNEMFDLKNQIKDKDEKIKQLEADYEKQTTKLENIRNDLLVMKETHENAWQNQSVCLNALSLTLGSLLWKASKEPTAVQSITTGDKLPDLFEIVRGSLRSFFDVYVDKLPDSKSDVKKFITTFVGIISNIAANSEGRSALVRSEEGQLLIKELLEKLPRIPKDEVSLNRVFLSTLFNVSINRIGLSLIENEFTLLERIVHNILSKNEQKKISLKLLESITYETKNQELIEYLSIVIPFEELKDSDDETSLKLNELMINMGKNSEYEEIVID
ncbi:uncharacterized protein LOC135832801 isoform X2 [Planococcus citri]